MKGIPHKVTYQQAIGGSKPGNRSGKSPKPTTYQKSIKGQRKG